MLCMHAASGGMRHCGYRQVGPEVGRRIAKTWPLVACVRELSAYGERGKALCVLRDKKTSQLQVGARTWADFEAIERWLGIGLHVM
jgi:hypothetical protein